MNRADPLDNLGSGTDVSAEIPPTHEDYEFKYRLVSERSKRDLQEFGLNMVDDYRDFKHELLSWLANYGSDGAYPWRERRGIAPAPPISFLTGTTRLQF